MRNIATLFASVMLLAAQAASPVPQQAAASGEAPSSAVVSVSLDTASAQPVKVTAPARPDFDSSQLAPLRAAQAKAAALAAAAKQRAARRTTAVTTASYVARAQAPATPENMQALRFCESGNTYTRNSGNGYYGAYQYDLGTWGNFQGYARPDLAPASVQDQKFLETFNRRGWAPWPACSRKLGFM